MFVTKNLSLCVFKSRRGSNGIEPPRMGHCWWFWLPRVHGNGGRPWRREVLDFSIQWLCFGWNFTLWPKPRKGDFPYDTLEQE